MPHVAQQLNQVRENILILEQKYGRETGSVQLLAVSKTRSSAEIDAAAKEGQRDFGENYLQEALEKISELREKGLCWHFIGPLQSNKARGVAEHFSWMHSVDRAKIAHRLSALRPASMAPLQVCIQVNISGEASKSGIAPGALEKLAEEVCGLPGLQLRGLMTLPAPETELETQRRVFQKLTGLFDTLNARGFKLDTLSMGTSTDMEAAIAEGATMVRIGTAVFGPRQ